MALPEPEPQTGAGGSRDGCSRFRFDLNAYLASLGPDAPVKTLADIVASRQFHPTIRQRLVSGLEATLPPVEQPGCAQQTGRDERLRRARSRRASRARSRRLDLSDLGQSATVDRRPQLAHGNNSQRLSPPTGFPALSVPMGAVGDGLPVGLQILGDAWSEQTLIAIAYAYERGTRHRAAPASTPPL